jgi:hypothetical protein
MNLPAAMATDSTARKLKRGSWSLAVIKPVVPEDASNESRQRRDVVSLTRDADRIERGVKNYFIKLFYIMDFFKSFAPRRQYETPLDLEQMSVDDILRIPPNEISTTKIMAEDDLFKAINPTKQAAVKYIAEQKSVRDKYGLRYPTPDEMVRNFNKRQADKEEARDMVNEARIKNLHDSLEAEKLLKNIQSPPPRKGGKKRSRKQRKQRRRKTRRSV